MAAPALRLVVAYICPFILPTWKSLICRASADTKDSFVLMMRVKIRLVYGAKIGPAPRIEDAAFELPF